jgi:hypothetical protein
MILLKKKKHTKNKINLVPFLNAILLEVWADIQ